MDELLYKELGLLGYSYFGVEEKRHRILLRHRSVGITTIVGYLLKALGFEVNVIHQSAWTWNEMRCGGRCGRCRFGDTRDNEAFVEMMKPWVRKFTAEIAGERQARIEQELEGW